MMWFPTALSSLLLLSPLAIASPLTIREDIHDCLYAAGVPYDEPGTTAWADDKAPFNTRLQYTPVAIAIATTVKHVQDAVACAVKLGVKVSPKCGGHGYASFGLGGEDGHLVVVLDRMHKVTLDNTTNVAAIEGGSRLGHVWTELWKQGKRAISHGTCPGVGIGGHALHGGFGFSSHTRGLALDGIVGATVVLANATVVNCSATQNKDLFWALKGAGSSYGIVTTFFYDTWVPPEILTVFTVNLPWNNVTTAVKTWTALQNFTLNDMPAKMNMRMFGNSFSTQLQGLYHGPSSELTTAIEPLLTAMGAKISQSRETDWSGAFTAYANGQTVDVTYPYHIQEEFFSKSLFTPALNETVMTSAVTYWLEQGRKNSRAWYIIIDMHGGKNSYISSLPKDSTSYYFRDSLWLYQFYDRSFGKYPTNGFSFLNGWVDAFTTKLDRSQWGMYINYADPTMDRAEATRNYWGAALPRLRTIKAAVDPKEVFYFPQGIEPLVAQ